MAIKINKVADDPRRKVWREETRRFDTIFQPKAVAVVGALMERMMQVAKKERLQRVFAEVQSDNFPMQRLLTAAGFKGEPDLENATVKMECLLYPAVAVL